jgi:hypothetical protein
LRQAGGEIPIVVLSAGYVPRNLKEHPQVAAILAKPFAIRDLLAMIERFCPSTT